MLCRKRDILYALDDYYDDIVMLLQKTVLLLYFEQGNISGCSFIGQQILPSVLTFQGVSHTNPTLILKSNMKWCTRHLVHHFNVNCLKKSSFFMSNLCLPHYFSIVTVVISNCFSQYLLMDGLVCVPPESETHSESEISRR